MPMDIEQYARHVHFYSGEVPQLLLDWLGRSQWQSFVDVGCGDGALLWALQQRGLLAGKEVHGVDLSHTRIELARGIDPAFDCQVGSATELAPLADSSIDFLVSTQVIEHVPDDNDMVLAIKRVLRPGGTVYLSTVHKKWYGWYFYRCNGRWVLDPTHLREYTEDSQLLDKFEAAGFRVLENRKRMFRFPLVDFFMRRLGASRNASQGRVAAALRSLRVPIIGYYNWEMILRQD